jgi:cytidylate kinase
MNPASTGSTDREVNDMNARNPSRRPPAPAADGPDPGTHGRAGMSDPAPAEGRTPRPVVTLFESYGSGAGYIGPRVAQALGLPFHPQAFSSDEIENATAQRENQGTLSRILSAVGGSYAGLDGPAVAMAQADDHDLVLQNTRVVHDQARAGGVILGRNGALILANQPAALHVMLDGPVRLRIERAARDSGIDLQRAAKRQKREDLVRAEMSIEFYGWDPRDTDRYDLVVNTGTMDLDICVDIIVQAALIKAGLRGAGPS